MSVLIVTKIEGDTAVFRQGLIDRASDLEEFAAAARGAGALHHRFGVGDGFVLIVDEWESPEQFQQFFANPELQAFVAAMGGSGPPETTIAEAISSPDEF